MLSCDRNKCAVNGPALARLSQKQLGFVDPATAATALSSAKDLFGKIGDFFGGLFGKDPDKTQFDYVRQNTWNHYAQIFDAVAQLRRTNQLTQDVLQGYVDSLGELISQYQAYYDRVRDAVGAQWGDSRFHDYYDPFVSTYQAWRTELQRGTLPDVSFGIPGFSGGSVAGMSGTQMLMLGGFALAIISSLRSKGR